MIIRGNTVTTSFLAPLQSVKKIAEDALPKTGGTMTGDILMSNKEVKNIPAPTENSSAANKEYVDNHVNDFVLSKRTSVQVILSSSNWSQNKQIVQVPAVTANAILLVSPAPEVAEQYTAYAECGVRCSGQEVGLLEFTCEDVPIIDLTVNVALFF